MVLLYTPLDELNDSKTEWIILVRINRKWLALKPGSAAADATLDYLAIDESGSQIHIEIDPDLKSIYEDVLIEGRIYVISKFHVIPTTSYEPVNRSTKIEFMNGTTATEFTGKAPYIPHHNFQLCQFADLAPHAGDDRFLIDVVGILHGIRNGGDNTDTRFGKTSKTDIVLRNLEQQILNATLWAKVGADFDALSLRHEEQTVVLILTSLTVKKFSGTYHVASTSATKIFVNLDNPIVTHYLKSMQEENQPPIILPPEKFSRNKSTAGEPDEIHTLAEILSMPRISVREQEFRVIVTIERFELAYGWYYDGCPNCTKSIREKYVKTTCHGCGLNTYAKPVYKIEAEVTDGSEKCNFIFFTHVAEQLIGSPIDKVMMDEHPVKRRIPKKIASFVNTNWELLVVVNKKSLTMNKLIFNVNKVVKQNSAPTMPHLYSKQETEELHIMPRGRPNESAAQITAETSGQSSTPRDKGKRPLVEMEDQPTRQPRGGSRLRRHRFVSQPSIQEIESLETIGHTQTRKSEDAYYVETPTSENLTVSMPLSSPPYSLLSNLHSTIQPDQLYPTLSQTIQESEASMYVSNLQSICRGETGSYLNPLIQAGYTQEEIDVLCKNRNMVRQLLNQQTEQLRPSIQMQLPFATMHSSVSLHKGKSGVLPYRFCPSNHPDEATPQSLLVTDVTHSYADAKTAKTIKVDATNRTALPLPTQNAQFECTPQVDIPWNDLRQAGYTEEEIQTLYRSMQKECTVQRKTASNTHAAAVKREAQPPFLTEPEKRAIQTHTLCPAQRPNIAEIQPASGNIILANVAKRQSDFANAMQAENTQDGDMSAFWKDIIEENNMSGIDTEQQFSVDYKGKQKVDYATDEDNSLTDVPSYSST